MSFKDDWLEKVEKEKNFECYNVLLDMIYDSGMFIGIFNGGFIYTSPDGEEWTKEFWNYHIRGINKCRQYYIGTGVGGYIGVNTTVHSLSQRSPPTDENLYACVCGSPTTYVAVGSGGTVVRALDTPSSFSKVMTGETQDLYDIAIGGIPESVYVAVGSNGVIIWAREVERGLNWHRAALITPNETLLAVHWANSKFIAVGTNGSVIESIDGKSWHKGKFWGDNSEFLGRRDVRCLGGSFTGICSNGRVVHGSGKDDFKLIVDPKFPYQRD